MDKLKTYTLLVVSVVALLNLRPAGAETLPSGGQTTMLQDSPLFADPSGALASVGTASGVLIADVSPASKGNFQRLTFTNLSLTSSVCVHWVAAAAACGSAVTCNIAAANTDVAGTLLLPRQSVERTVPGTFRTCGLATASPTLLHVSRAGSPL